MLFTDLDSCSQLLLAFVGPYYLQSFGSCELACIRGDVVQRPNQRNMITTPTADQETNNHPGYSRWTGYEERLAWIFGGKMFIFTVKDVSVYRQ